MNYTVGWDSAVEELAEASLGPAGRAAVADASHRLEQDLVRDPIGRGVAGTSSVNRFAVDPPLAIEYEIIEDDKRVRITHVWSIV